ncbi:DNA-binding protein [Marinobacterium sediminicola]|uniref:Replication region DNA-binding N-term n=1 Tax=Marinobacterium sediminicola TaxID=518898 RepID=A0ABY1RY30_9GAMM|nr:DNA-binding protein [Marinobacterium sediminicola]ULG70747.1 DNA-binding protein [Marinobacterium sediminicola]SMR71688.1 replication region DNA-binding N-term [Marinobacterium sediminicola]
MTRKNDTHSRAIEIADKLLEEGIRPTQQNVRERLGTGSLTTINRALNDWWHTLAERVQRRNEHPELPEPVVQLANQTWNRALAYAEHRFNQQRAEIERQQAELKQAAETQRSGGEAALLEAQKQNARLLERCERLADEKHMLEKRLLEAEEQHIRLSMERDRALHEIKQLKKLSSHQGMHDEAIIELKVQTRIQEEELQRLRRQNDQLSKENAAYKARN